MRLRIITYWRFGGINFETAAHIVRGPVRKCYISRIISGSSFSSDPVHAWFGYMPLVHTSLPRLRKCVFCQIIISQILQKSRFRPETPEIFGCFGWFRVVNLRFLEHLTDTISDKKRNSAVLSYRAQSGISRVYTGFAFFCRIFSVKFSKKSAILTRNHPKIRVFQVIWGQNREFFLENFDWKSPTKNTISQ